MGSFLLVQMYFLFVALAACLAFNSSKFEFSRGVMNGLNFFGQAFNEANAVTGDTFLEQSPISL